MTEKEYEVPVAVRVVINCPECNTQHIDKGVWATKDRLHKTHLCENCSHEWRPHSYFTVGVEKLPYSGKTTAHHPSRDPWEDTPGTGQDCITTRVLFDVQWSNCPVEVESEVKQLWRDNEYGNAFYYAYWDGKEMGEDYPIIYEYLTSRGIQRCLIHWWW